jgi:arylsulfatase A-like enzyme
MTSGPGVIFFCGRGQGRAALFLVVGALWGAASCSGEETPLRGSTRAPLPNIIFILSDDQGWGATSVSMDPSVPESASDFVRTPRLERLAAAGMRFARAYAPHPNCSPSRASLLTGVSPAALGFTDVPRPRAKYEAFYQGNRLLPPEDVRELDAARVTLPELIKAAHPEYRAAHFGKWHLGAGGPEAHGFDQSDGDTGNDEGSAGGIVSKDPKRCFSVTRRSIAWMRRQVDEGRPFFLQVSHYAPHLAFQSRLRSLSEFKQSSPGLRHQSVGFAAMSLDLDAAIGQLLDAVDELSPPERTWVFYTSDNGTYPTDDKGSLNGPLRGCKATVWEGGLRVPFLVRGPGVGANRVSRVPVIGYDLYPTIAELVGGAALPGGLEGGSLLPVLRGEGAQSVVRVRDAFCFHWPHYQHVKQSKPDSAWLDLASGEKLHYFWEDGRQELYDLDQDLAEGRDLCATRAQRAAELRTRLEAYLEEVGAPRPAKNPAFDPALDPALRTPSWQQDPDE